MRNIDLKSLSLNKKKKEDEFNDDFEGDELAAQRAAEDKAREEELAVFVASPPNLNLIPEQVLAYYGILQIRNKILAVVAIIALVFVGFYGYNKFNVNDVQSQIDELGKQTATVQSQTQALMPFQQFYKGVNDARLELAEYTKNDTDTGAIMAAVDSAASAAGVKLSNVSVNVTGTDSETTQSTTCPSPDPFGSYSSSGCIMFEGNAPDRQSVAVFAANLSQTPGFQNAYIPNTSIGETGARVQGSVSFTAEFLTQRYSNLGVDLSQSQNSLGIPTTEEQLTNEGTQSEQPVEGEQSNG